MDVPQTVQSGDELNESILGTLEYWDDRYRTEIDNFRNHGDIGEVWFGEESVDRVLRWMQRSPLIKKEQNIIDLGCGNGHFLVELAKNGFVNLLGVDYSKDAIILANEISKKENVNINFKESDFLFDDFNDKFDVIHDKGTYDAISLSSNACENRQLYIDKLINIILPNGLFIITSCNWTSKELEDHFAKYFKVIHNVPTPKFQFGGQTGNTVTTIIFQRQDG